MRIPLLPRPRATYANIASTAALALALSMGGAYAAGKIGPNDIQNNAVKSHHIDNGHVKTPDLKGKAVTKAKLAPNARAAKVIRYSAGPHDFAVQPSFFLPLPGVKAGHVRSNEWSVQVVYGNDDVVNLDDYDYAANRGAFMRFTGGQGGVAFQNLALVSDVDAIHVFQTIPLTTKAAAAGFGKSKVAPGE